MRHPLVLLFFFSINVLIAKSQNILTLDNAIKIGLDKNLGILEFKKSVDIAQSINTVGYAGGLPSVIGSASQQGGLLYSNQKFKTSTTDALTNVLSPISTTTVGVNVGWVLYNGSKIVATKKRLNELQKISETQLVSTLQNTIATIMTQYYNIVQQESYLKIIEINAAVNQTKLDIINNKHVVGLANDPDLFQSEIDLNTTQQQIISQQLVVKQALADLLNTLHANPDSAVTIVDTIIVDSSILLDSVLNKIPANPDILVANRLVTVQQQNIRVAKSQRLPSVVANGGVGFYNLLNPAVLLSVNRNYGPTLGLSLNVPIYQGGSIKAQEKYFQLNAEQAKLRGDSILANYITNAVKVYDAYQSSLQQIAKQQATFALAEKLVKLVLDKYALSEATILDVKTAQQSLVDAGTNLINYLFLSKSSEIELKRIEQNLQ
ncbi:MAG: TolC family protein [Phycisphaerales bacterium]|nr:TolC family protein [Phycisphaerales bacterium]